MFVVTFLNFDTFRIKVLALCETEEVAREALYSHAKNYVLEKDGQRNMRLLSPDEVKDCPFALGHFLCEVEPDCLDLYDKTQNVVSGMFSSYVDSKIKRLGRYQMSPHGADCSPDETLSDFLFECLDGGDFIQTTSADTLPAPTRKMIKPPTCDTFDSVIKEMVRTDFKKSLKSIKQ